MRRLPFAPSFAAACVAVPLALAGCGGATSPYADSDAEATEGTGELPEGALNRSLDPGDAGTVGPANLEGEPDGEEAGATTEAGSRMDAEGADDAEPVTAKPVSYEEFQAIVDAADGPVLVDVWADWCIPCREAFPHTVALAKEHADDGLSVVSLAMNSEEDLGEVQKFLTEAGAGQLTNLYTDDGGNSAQWDPLAGPMGLPLPTVLIFDAEGNETARVVGAGSGAEAELDAAIEAALGG